jgi:hypothetical protein
MRRVQGGQHPQAIFAVAAIFPLFKIRTTVRNVGNGVGAPFAFGRKEETMGKYNLIALTNPIEGREDEFNDWYTHEHLADVLKLPGVTAAQRYMLGDVQHRKGPLEWKYMAVYEIEIDDISETLDALAAASGTEAMPLSPALSSERMVWIYRPITDRVVRPR